MLWGGGGSMIKKIKKLMLTILLTSTGLFNLYADSTDEIDRLIQSTHKYHHSPTAAVIKMFARKSFITSGFCLEKEAFPGAVPLIERIMTLEHEEGKQGRFTLTHAKVKGFHLSQSIFKLLYESKHGDIGFPYVFTRFDKNIANTSFLTDNNHKVESKNNLFLSPACLGITLGFYLQNYSAFNYKPDLQKIFALFEQDALYKKHKKELCQLEEEATAMYPYGQILLLSFSKDALEKYVYPTFEDGKRMPVYEYNHENYGKEICSMQSVLSKFKENPKSVKQDKLNCLLEFCFCHLNYIPKYDVNKNPEVKIFRFGADPKKKALYDAKERALLSKIVYDIQRSRKQEIDLEQEINLMTSFLP